jgi:hypothetical protein
VVEAAILHRHALYHRELIVAANPLENLVSGHDFAVG